MTATHHKAISISFGALLVFLSGLVYAGSPVWTFLPLRATTISVSTADTATIQYQVTNQSRKTHVLKMRGITGISQNTTPGNCTNPFTLGYQQSCTLTLTVDGSSLQGAVVGGPVVCQQGNASQCYQPSRSDSLNITLTTAPGATTLSTSVSHLALSKTGYTEYGLPGTPTPTSGVARTIEVTNTGSNATSNLSISYPPNWPSGTTATTNCGPSLAANGSCTITIPPGNTATSDGTNPCTTTGTAPVAQTISISADNASTVSSTVVILGYGCIYQGGYVYALDDTTPGSSSVGGKVAGLTNVSNSNKWTESRVDIAGAESTTNGAQNTTDIMADASCTDSPTDCAAYQCRINFTGGEKTDWYLPAICEEGYDTLNSGSGCGTAGSPTLQNMQSNLVDIGNVGLAGSYWSSTEFSGLPVDAAWIQNFALSDASQFAYYKFSMYGVRCSRALTL